MRALRMTRIIRLVRLARMARVALGASLFFVSGWMEGQEAVKDVAFYFLLGVGVVFCEHHIY